MSQHKKVSKYPIVLGNIISNYHNNVFIYEIGWLYKTMFPELI